MALMQHCNMVLETTQGHQSILGNTEKASKINLALSKYIQVWSMMEYQFKMFIGSEKKQQLVNRLGMFWKLRISRDLQINLMTSKKANTLHKWRNLWQLDIKGDITGQIKLQLQINLPLVWLLLEVKMLNKCCTPKAAQMKMKSTVWCTLKPTVTLPQVSKKLVTILGKMLIKPNTDLAMANNGYSMEQLWAFIMKDSIKVSQKLLLLRKQLKIKRLSHKIY